MQVTLYEQRRICGYTETAEENYLRKSKEAYASPKSDKAEKTLGLNMKEDPFLQFARGLMNWSQLVNTIDFETFQGMLEQLRGFKISEQYALELWDVFENPAQLRARLRGEFPEFMRIAMGKSKHFGLHKDLVP